MIYANIKDLYDIVLENQGGDENRLSGVMAAVCNRGFVPKGFIEKRGCVYEIEMLACKALIPGFLAKDKSLDILGKKSLNFSFTLYKEGLNSLVEKLDKRFGERGIIFAGFYRQADIPLVDLDKALRKELDAVVKAEPDVRRILRPGIKDVVLYAVREIGGLYQNDESFNNS